LGTGARQIVMLDKLASVPAHSLLGRIIRLPLRLLPANSVIRIKTGVNKGFRWRVGSGVHGYWIGNYEKEKQAVFDGLVKTGANLVDIGANAGFYTLAFSRITGSGGHVWAFEPYAANAASLLDHIKMNRLSNVTLMQCAVGSRAGMSGFHVSDSNAMGALAEDNSSYIVPTVTLDYLVQQNIIPIPDLVKMDVEGGESEVLEGAGRILEQQKTILQIALHGSGQGRRCMEILKRHNYQVYSLAEAPLGEDIGNCDEIIAYPQGMENKR
jgi:FkbM family methyltransferase